MFTRSMVRRILCPWTLPVSLRFKMNFAELGIPSTSDGNQKEKGSHKSTILVAVLVIFVMILLITMDIHKDKRNRQSKNHDAEDLWIHGKNSEYHYGIVLDCGSTGSRVYIYYWPDHNGNPEHLLDMRQMIDNDGQPVRLKVRPGISTFEDKPENASQYIYPLLRHAANHIPKSKHSETPLYILATAGMRLLPKQKQDAIMKNLITNIPVHFDFLFSSTHVEVITGKQEGVYAWITINYVLGRFNHSHDTAGNDSSAQARKPTVGSLDMGGASTQITFEVPQNEKLPANLTAEVNLGCDSHRTTHKYKLYVTTFLGYGASMARYRYLERILKRRNSSVHSHSRVYLDPCLPTDTRIKGTHDGMKYRLKGIGDFDMCRNQLLPLLNKTVSCPVLACSFNGVHQPRIHFNTTSFYGFSEFWYSVNDVLRLKGVYNSVNFNKASKDFCKTKWPVLYQRYQSKLYPLADEHRFMYQCFKSAWMTTVLHSGFNFPKSYKKLHPTFLIDGKEIQWTLGAILYRTRFLPLREMQTQHFHTKIKVKFSLHYQLNYYVGDSGYKAIILLCSVVVIALIFIICRKLRRIPSPSISRQPLISTTPNYPTDFRISM